MAGSWAQRFFGVAGQSRTWLGLVYQLLAFPLGLFYFVMLVVGLSVGLSLVLIAFIGIPILAVTVAFWWVAASFERAMSDAMLGTSLGPSPRPWQNEQGTWRRIRAHFSSLSTWKDLFYLFLKFPLGLITFVAVTVALSIPLALLATPFSYRFAQTQIGGTVHHGIYLGFWTIDTFGEAMLVAALGLLVAFVSLHALNLMAVVWRVTNEALLGHGPSSASPQPQPRPVT